MKWRRILIISVESIQFVWSIWTLLEDATAFVSYVLCFSCTSYISLHEQKNVRQNIIVAHQYIRIKVGIKPQKNHYSHINNTFGAFNIFVSMFSIKESILFNGLSVQLFFDFNISCTYWLQSNNYIALDVLL